MRDEGSCRRAARYGLHHRSFHLEEPPIDEEASQVIDDRGAHPEDAPGFLIGDEVEIALPVTGLPVGESMKLLRQGS